MKKKIRKNLVSPQRFYTLYEQKFSNLTHFFQLFFPKDSKNLKSLDIGLREVGEKIPLNGVRNTKTNKKSCSLRQNSPLVFQKIPNL